MGCVILAACNYKYYVENIALQKGMNYCGIVDLFVHHSLVNLYYYVLLVYASPKI